MKLLIFLSALLTGLTGALAGEQRIAASAHSVSQVLAVAEESDAAQTTALRPNQPKPTILAARSVTMQALAGPFAQRPRDAIPAKLQV